MKKFYPLIAITLIAMPAFSQLTLLKSGGATSFGGAGIGSRVIFADFSTGAIGGTDGTVAGTANIPSGTVYLASGDAVAAVNNRIIFAGADATSGNEVWSSDGTLAGTIKLMDINPGAANSDIAGGTNNLPVVNGYAYFSANDGTGIRKLYRSNGTIAGTSLVKDLGAVTISFPLMVSPVGANLYFVVNGKQLWKSDGTGAGTVLVKDFSPGGVTTFSNMFVGSGVYTYFLANDGSNGLELWRTDGTLAGTIMLANYGAGSSDGFSLFSGSDDWNATSYNNMLFFQPNNAGAKLYKTDGSIAGTAMVIDLNPGGGGGLSIGNGMTIWNNFYFSGNGSIYKSDGTAVGTTQVKYIGTGNINMLEPQENLGNSITPGNFAGGKFFFIADDGVNGNELWVSDGSTAGTFMLKNIAPGSASAFPANDEQYFYTKYKLFFAANDATNGVELWETDGTTIGTVMTMNINPGAGSSNPEIFGVSLNSNKMVLAASDGTGVNIYSLNATVVPFPLALTDFTAQLRNTEVLLNWTTQNETNVSHFNIQRSITGKEFATIGKVNATNQSQNSYGFTDGNYAKSGIVYYRLEMVDKDGKLTYSKMQTIKLKSGFDFNLSSTRNEIMLNLGDANGAANLKITDGSGRIQIQQKIQIASGEMIRLSTANLAAGIYYVTIELNGNIQTKRFVK